MDPEDARLMETDKFLGELTADKPFLSIQGFELVRRYSPISTLDTEQVLSLVVARYVNEGVGSQRNQDWISCNEGFAEMSVGNLLTEHCTG